MSNHGDAGNSNPDNSADSEPERVEVRQNTGDGRSQTAGGKVQQWTQ